MTHVLSSRRPALLDEAIFATYAWLSNRSESEILERLLALNHQRAGKPPDKKKEK